MTSRYIAKSRYTGKTAIDYDTLRGNDIKWYREIRIIEQIVSKFDKGTHILDIPVGTGRFYPKYAEYDHFVFGLDISMDMISQAKAKFSKKNIKLDLILGDAERLPLKNKAVDYVVCIRLLNFVNLHILKNILQNYKRVSRQGIIIGVRTARRCKFIDLFKYVFNIFTTNDSKHFVIILNKKIRQVISFFKKMYHFDSYDSVVTNYALDYEVHDESKVYKIFNDLKLNIYTSFYVESHISLINFKVTNYWIYYLVAKE